MWGNVTMGDGNRTLGLVAPCKENTCAAVVTYFPDTGLRDRLQQTADQVAQIVIIDNGSDDETFERVQTAVQTAGRHLIRNAANLGIAAAMNQGIQWAHQQGFRWVLLLDQDSVPAKDMVSRFIQAFGEFPDKSRLAIVGLNRILNSAANARRRGNAWWEIGETVITSGTLLQLEAAQQIGSLREEFFIDCVDFEYCLRARAMGFKIVEILTPIMKHSIGDPKTVRLLGFRIHAYNHQPWRSYYKVRNFIALMREYAFINPWWIMRMSWATARTTMVALLMEKSRIPKFKYVLLGLYDGLSGSFRRHVI